MSISKNHSDQARRNGALSRGPITPEGKQRSAMNAFKHGIFSKSAVLSWESQEDFDQLLHLLTEHYNPRTGAEALLIEREAVNLWRLTRLQRAEGALIEDLYRRERKRLIGHRGMVHNYELDIYEGIEANEDEEFDDDATEEKGAPPPEPPPLPTHQELLASVIENLADTQRGNYIRRERESIERGHRRFLETLQTMREMNPGFVSQNCETQ